MADTPRARRRAGLTLLACLAVMAAQAGCRAASPANIQTAQRFRARLEAGDFDAARAMMTSDPRRWFDSRTGPGQAWRVGPGEKGPWALWDETLGQRVEALAWEGDERSATLVYRETNDYFLLLERGWVTNRTTYYFDGQGRIEGILHAAAAAPRPPGRTAEFLDWARQHEPQELDALMPDGDIDPSGDHAERFRALLGRWRVAAGLSAEPSDPDGP